MILHDVEQGTDEWLNLRAGKPTSSMFGSLVTGTGSPSKSLEKYALTLATEVLIGGPIDDGWQGNKFMERGKELEAEARLDYEMTHAVKVEPVGFITDDLMRWGSSTDGLVGDDGLVEIKNLIATRFVELMVYVRKNEKIPPEYIPQIQGELFVSERKWCDIIFYHPQFQPIVHRHTPIESYHVTLKSQLTKCLAERNNIVKLLSEDSA